MGFWPLAFVGIAVYENAAPRRLRSPATSKWSVVRRILAVSGMVWMWFLTIPDYLLAVTMFTGTRLRLGGTAQPVALIGRRQHTRLSKPCGSVFPSASLSPACRSVSSGSLRIGQPRRWRGAADMVRVQIGFALSGRRR